MNINKPEATHNNFFHINCDISSVSSIKKASLEVDSFTKKVDHLVSNAGVHSFGSLKDLTEEKYEIIFNINVKGTLFFIQNFVTLIENNYGGSIFLSGFRSIICKVKALVKFCSCNKKDNNNNKIIGY
ncbi:SDR family NAD(P)-dependent oxidoreductase [Piscirickettsia salmonis]|uniref:SDR family NAD(P)-dependent oxidoreductase n=1 Tax=Piscirickettsia salmonis TaxID=1238 RepID=UPI00143DCF8A|nr:SDR family NAD(P)-dependent oxidoreductase [Piscirickettsia salmonis]QIX57331.1 SDR family NAD(P)-dependent oxidoreductase [Piscirickettsia salmonis]